MDVFPYVAAQRRAVADHLESIAPEQWQTPSLCRGWTVRHVAAHMAPANLSMKDFTVELLRCRGSMSKATMVMADRAAQAPTTELVANLRRFADRKWVPPTMPPAAPLTDALVHAQDILVPLGVQEHAPVIAWCEVLDFVHSRSARRGFVDGELPAVQWIATDAPWQQGQGPPVRGRAEDLALAALGRRPGLENLTGEGAELVRQRWT